MSRVTILFLFSLLFSVAFAQSSNLKLDTFQNESYSLVFPSDWTVNTSGLMGTDCFISSPLVSSNDSFSENINIIRTPLPKDQIESRDAIIGETIRVLGKMASNFKLISQSREIKNNQETDVLIYSFTQGVYDLKLEQRFVLANDQMYIITVTQALENADFSKELASALDSFTVEKSED